MSADFLRANNDFFEQPRQEVSNRICPQVNICQSIAVGGGDRRLHSTDDAHAATKLKWLTESCARTNVTLCSTNKLQHKRIPSSTENGDIENREPKHSRAAAEYSWRRLC